MPLRSAQYSLATAIDVYSPECHTQFYHFVNWANAVPFYLKSCHPMFYVRKTNSGITPSERSLHPQRELFTLSLESAPSYL